MQREFEKKIVHLKNGLSEDTKDLIRNMLKVDSIDRCDIKWILNHPALTKYKDKFRQPITEDEFATLIRNYMINTKGTEGRDMPDALVEFINMRQQNSNKKIFKDVNLDINKDYNVPIKSSDFNFFYNNQSNQNNAQNLHAPRGQIFERLSNIHHAQPNNYNHFAPNMYDNSNNNQSNTHNLYSMNDRSGPDTRFLKSNMNNSKPLIEPVNNKPQLNLNSNVNYVNNSQRNINKAFTNQGDNSNYNRAPYQDQRSTLHNSTPFPQHPTEGTYKNNGQTNLTSSLHTEQLHNTYGQNNSVYKTQVNTVTPTYNQQAQTVNWPQTTQYGLSNSLTQTGNQTFNNSNNFSKTIQNPGQSGQLTQNSTITRTPQLYDHVMNRNSNDGQNPGVTKVYQSSQYITNRTDDGVKNMKISYEIPASRDSGNKTNQPPLNNNMMKQDFDSSRINLGTDYNLTTRRYTLDKPNQTTYTDMTINKPLETKIDTDRGLNSQPGKSYIYNNNTNANTFVDREKEFNRILPKSFSSAMIQQQDIQRSNDNRYNGEKSGYNNFVFTQPNKIVQISDSELKKLDSQLGQKTVIQTSNFKNFSTSDLNGYRKMSNDQSIQNNGGLGKDSGSKPLLSRKFQENTIREIGKPMLTSNMSYKGLTQVRRL